MSQTPEVISRIRRGEAVIGIVGLGYVGLPLASVFSRKWRTIGFDISKKRIESLRRGVDSTRELSEAQLSASKIEFTGDEVKLRECDVVIVTVPTPIDEHRNPDLALIRLASETVGRNLKHGAIVVYESTVYPGVTEDECVPILERTSGLRWKTGFYAGYSPERINPGDKQHTVDKILKVVAGDSPEIGEALNFLYGSVITAGTYLAANIKTAEAAKVIENTQRDLNIALMNELSIIFSKMGINTLEVLEAAGTKWNFLPFRPGLVGGHCIGVDPYYLTWKAQSLGYEPEVILAGRRINDSMGKYVAERTVKLMIQSGSPVRNSRVLILGVTFKENVPDVRNTKVVDIRTELLDYGVRTEVFDPVANPDEVEHEYGFRTVASPSGEYDAVVIAVKHRDFSERYDVAALKALFGGKSPLVIDIKGMYSARELAAAGVTAWQL